MEELQHWCVKVDINWRHVLSISSDSLLGRDLSDVDKAGIRAAAENLLAFVGERSKEDEDAHKAMRSNILRIAAACARFQHMEVETLTQDDLKQFGEYAVTLRSIYDRM